MEAITFEFVIANVLQHLKRNDNEHKTFYVNDSLIALFVDVT